MNHVMGMIIYMFLKILKKQNLISFLQSKKKKKPFYNEKLKSVIIRNVADWFARR